MNNSYNTGIASEYLVLSMLFRLELEAYISAGNKKSIDIRVINKYGRPISIDVKSVRDYSSIPVNNVSFQNDHFIVFVIYNKKFNELDSLPEFFIVPSSEIENITKSFQEQKRVFKGALNNFKDKWDYITSGYGEDGVMEEE